MLAISLARQQKLQDLVCNSIRIFIRLRCCLPIDTNITIIKLKLLSTWVNIIEDGMLGYSNTEKERVIACFPGIHNIVNSIMVNIIIDKHQLITYVELMLNLLEA